MSVGPSEEPSVEDADDLFELLGSHLQGLRDARAHAPFLDLALAEAVHARLAAILHRWATYDRTGWAEIRTAVLYVVEDDDEEHDIRSPIGLVDDEERVTALEDYLASRGQRQER